MTVHYLKPLDPNVIGETVVGWDRPLQQWFATALSVDESVNEYRPPLDGWYKSPEDAIKAISQFAHIPYPVDALQMALMSDTLLVYPASNRGRSW